MRTTNKEIKVQIQEHIINCLGEEFETVQENLQEVVEWFNNWYCGYEQKRTPNKQEAFREFLQGLPSCFNVEFTHHGIHTTLKSWFENVGSTYKDRTEEQEAHTYYALVFREFRTLCKQNGVQF